jgi:hypothetical protein
MALSLQERLKGGCEHSDIVIIDSSSIEKKRFFKSQRQKDIEKLKSLGIRVLTNTLIKEYQEQCLWLQDGSALAFDILIPTERGRENSLFAKSFGLGQGPMTVQSSLKWIGGDHVYMHGVSVQRETDALPLEYWAPSELATSLRHNLFRESEDTPLLDTRVRAKRVPLALNSAWKEGLRREIKELQKIETLKSSQISVETALSQQSLNRPRPWRFQASKQKGMSLVSMSGFNLWGDFADSACKIVEMALLKSIVQGFHRNKSDLNSFSPVTPKWLFNPFYNPP